MKIKKVLIGIAQGLLSISMLMAGTMKMITPYEELVKQMPWAESFSPMLVILIGALEVLGVIGMNLPFLLKKYKQLVPLAAGGLALTMFGAVVTLLIRGEDFIPPLVILFIALIVTYSRRGLLKADPA